MSGALDGRVTGMPLERRSVAQRLPWEGLVELVLLTVTIAAADAGIFTEADGVITAIACAVLRPSLIPYLLLVVAGFQDAKGLSGNWWYGGTVVFGVATFVFNSARPAELFRCGRRDYRDLVSVGVVTILYTVVSSYVLRWTGIHEQASTREPIVVGVLAITMLIFGASLWESLSVDPRAARRVSMVLSLMFLNGLAVSIARMFMGYETFVSAAGVAGMDEGAEQLFENTPFGFPRLTGTYLTPIGFAMYIGYLLILYEAIKRAQRVRAAFVLIYCVLGLALALISLSKDIAVFFVITGLAFAIVRVRLVLPTLCIGLALLAAGVLLVGLDGILEAFRFESGTSTESYRLMAWTAILNSFTWSDWLFGTGIAYWPVFLEKAVGFRLSDPHTFVLSIPGTYGLLGVAFYLMLMLYLVAAIRAARGYLRMVAIALVTMFFVVDLTSIPYVIGNTPITMLIWAALSALGRRDGSLAMELSLRSNGADNAS